MITQELLGYIRADSAKGRTREEISQALMAGGGWSMDDLSEAFRAVFPMQSVVQPAEKPVVLTPPPIIIIPPVLSTLPPPISFTTPRPVVVPPPPILIIPPVSPTPPPPPTISFTPPKPIVPPPPISFIPPYVPAPAPKSSFTIPPASPSVSVPPSSIRSFSPPSFSPPTMSKTIPLPKPSSSHFIPYLLKFLIILVIICGLGFSLWYYRSRVINLWDSLVNKSSELPLSPVEVNPNTSLSNPVAVAPSQVPPPITPTTQVKDCGTVSATFKSDTPSTYQNDPVLYCLGVSAFNCENARGVLKDDLFPTVFEINKSLNSCNFKLSYPADSALIDITGKKLALQYISCPINTVKAIDNTNSAFPRFASPEKTDLRKYASDIYFYGTLGLFVENNLDQNKIQALGCNGEYIQSMIASYNQRKIK